MYRTIEPLAVRADTYVNALKRDESYRFSAPKINANASSQRKNEQLKNFQIVVTISAELVTP